MKKSLALILALSILLTVCSGVFAAETALNLSFSDMSGDIANKSDIKYNKKSIISFFTGADEGSKNSIAENGPYGNYYKSYAKGSSANTVYTFPGKDFTERTTKLVSMSYIIRNTNKNRLRSTIRPTLITTNSSTTLYEWENNLLKPVSNNVQVGADKHITMDPDKYYHVNIIVDCAGEKWYLFIDGKNYGEYKLLESFDWSGGFFYVTLQNYATAEADGEVHLDEYKITFLDEADIEILPFADIIEDGKKVDSFSVAPSDRKLQFHIINNTPEQKSIMAVNKLESSYGEYFFMENYKLIKKTLVSGYNTVTLTSPIISEGEKKSSLYFWDSIFKMNSYGSFTLDGKPELKGE